MMRRHGWLGVVLGAACGSVGVAMANTPPRPARPALASAGSGPVDAAFFSREVQPLLQKRCLGCHGVGARLSGYDLRERDTAVKGGTHGVALVPGSAAKSRLYMFLTGERSPQMPPGGKLPAAEIAVFRRWIDGGAPWSDGKVETAAEQVWWSFRAPVAPPVPKLPHSEWVKNPIDAFVLAKLRANGLSPSPPAPRRTLIRRAYLDMIGLPPTPEEVRAFEADRSPNAWEKVVDRLLASPHYGERWGRHWLDLVRYADSSGFEGDKDRPLAWRYRDYVIESFNQDKPYDQFLREQLAGDELRPDDPTSLIATGYLACGPQDQVQKNDKTRSDELDDLVSTTGSVMLGLTLGCARCHDHKYDPVKQTDYYRLSAIFAPTERREEPVCTAGERQAVAAHNAAIEKELAPLRPRFEALKQQGTQAAKAAGHGKPNDDQIAAALPEAERKELAVLHGQIAAGEAKKQSLPQGLIVTDKSREWGPSHLLIRGDASHPGQEVHPGFIVSLPGGKAEVPASAATSRTTGRRRALAEWIASSRNPLTARVWVNRVWRQHFGRGIVASPSNFGINGELPTHPELLDWLASRFASEAGVPGPGAGSTARAEVGSSGAGVQRTLLASTETPPGTLPVSDSHTAYPGWAWRLKPLHRLILLSATYQQSSAIRPEAMRADPLNRWVWRMPVRRLEAEAIRDSILSVCGSLNEQMGGPPIYPPVDPTLRANTFLGMNWPEAEDNPGTWRRSVYVKVKRSLLLPELEVFDCPEITASVSQRNVTTTPTQALMLLNDPLIHRQAERFAARLRKEAGEDPRRQVIRAYELALSRVPTERETALSLRFLKERSLVEFCHAVLNLNEFVYAP